MIFKLLPDDIMVLIEHTSVENYKKLLDSYANLGYSPFYQEANKVVVFRKVKTRGTEGDNAVE